MNKTEFVSGMKEVYSEIREIGGSIIYDGENRTRSGDEDIPGIKPSVQLAWDLWDKMNAESCEALLERLRDYIAWAQHCIEAQQNPLTRDPEHANCRPIVTIDENGSPTCEWRR